MPAQAIQADAPSALASLTLALAQPRENGLRALGDDFYTPVAAAPLPDPVLVGYSDDAGRLIGLPPDAGATPEFLALFSGNRSRAEAPAERPIATVYSGHQFGVWAGQLGDGRALLLGEAGPPDARYEVQLKGAGLTPYSRMGDGRAVLRSSIREFLCSEAMHHLGIPTTRALSVIGSPLPVRRETIETAAVVTRLAPSFVRFGHFEHFYAARRTDLMETLANHVIDRHFPHCRQAEDPVLALFGETLDRTAAMIAQWQGVGFCHGVMNTDNMSILGLTIDYGPFGFLDAYDAKHICNHTDTGGRYAYGMQPRVAHWNLFCLAQVLLPLIGAQRGAAGDERAVEDVQGRLETFPAQFDKAYAATMQAKLGLTETRDGDAALVTALFDAMQQGGADFTLTFRHLCDVASNDASRDAPVRDLFLDRSLADAWLAQYRARLRAEDSDDARRAAAMKRVNPLYVLRNHLAEVAIRRAAQHDYSEVARLLDVLRRPYDEQPGRAAYAALPPEWATSLEVSCSS